MSCNINPSKKGKGKLKMKNLKVTITGIGTMLMHSDKLVDPLSPEGIAHNKLTSDMKYKKTFEGKVAIAKSMYINSFYVNSNNEIFLPMLNIRKSLIEGARQFKLGKDIERALIFVEDPVLQYTGPQTPKELWADQGKFIDARPVVIGRAKVMAYRPAFSEWKVDFTCHYDNQRMKVEDIKRCWETAGAVIGIGDFRPLFGRYEVEVKEV